MFEWLRLTKKHTAPQNKGLVAASAIVTPSYSNRRKFKFSDGQAAAWNAYYTVPEIKYGVSWKAAAMSRATLFAGEPDEDGQGDPVPTDQEVVKGVLKQLFEGFSGQSEMLRRMSVLLDVPGEVYSVGVSTDKGPRWVATNGNNLTKHSAQDLAIRLDINEAPVVLTQENSTVIRIWRPDGEDELNSDSPVRSLLPIVQQLLKLDQHIDATAESRLSGAGILKVPEGATSVNPGGGEGIPLLDDPFVAGLTEAMVTPIQDRDSASAVVPIVIKVPSGADGDVEFITMSTPFDDRVLPLREADLKRIAVGLDIPSEILTGIAESNHWTAWQISEDAIRLNIEPVLGLICDAFTKQYLWPALESLKVPNPRKYVIWYDTSELVLRPNRGPEARELYTLGILSAQATRRESGFSEDDAPTPEESARRLITNLVTQNPELAPQLIPMLAQGVTQDLGFPLALGTSPSSTDTVGEPARAEIPTMTAAEGDHEIPKWQLAVAEIATIRALERAGNWLLGRVPRGDRRDMQDIPAWELHTVIASDGTQYDKMLQGAYQALFAALPQEPCITKTVDTYVRSLIQSKQKHSREKLALALMDSGCVTG